MATIDNRTKNTVVSGSSDADSIVNYAGGVKIVASGGNDTIRSNVLPNYTINSSYGNVTIDGGAGNDLIYANDPHLSISGGDGNDTISPAGTYGTITMSGGTGNDSIYNETASHEARVYQYFHGDGNDTIWNYSASDTISLGSHCYYSTMTSGSNIIVSIAGSGAITLKDAVGKKVNLTDIAKSPVAYTNFIYNYTPNKQVNGTSSADTVRNHAGGVYISSGAGNDYICSSELYNYASTNPETIHASKGNDTVYLSNASAVIVYEPGDGYDTIYGYSSDDTIDIGSTAYALATTNNGSDAVVSLASGMLTIKNTATTALNIRGGLFTGSNSRNYATLSGTSAKDTLSNSGNYATVLGHAGDDSINNFGNSPTVTSASARYGYQAVIYGGDGNDTLNNYAQYATLYGGDGADYIYNSSYGEHAQLFGGDGNDSIRNSAAYAILEGGADNDTLTNTNLGIKSDLYGGAGDDYLSSYAADGVFLFGGYGNDTLVATGSAKNVTVQGGSGSNLIYGDSVNSQGLVYYYTSTAYDTIYSYSANDTIKIYGTQGYVVDTLGADVRISLVDSAGYVSIVGAASKNVKISGGTKLNITNNYTKNKTVTGSASADTIYNYAGGVYVIAGAGNDYVYSNIDADYTINSAYGYVTLDGGSGNDTIVNLDGNVSISGGAGTDLISLTSSAAGITVNGGAGSDSIANAFTNHVQRVYQYASGDGFDTITNYGDSDVISLASGLKYETIASGSGVSVSVSSGGIYIPDRASVSIVGGVNPNLFENTTKNITVYGTSANDTISNYAGGVHVSAGSGDDSIYNSTRSEYTINSSYGYLTIDGGEGNDSITSNDPYVSIRGGQGDDYIYLSNSFAKNNTIYAGYGNDTITLNSSAKDNRIQYYSGNGEDVIYGYNTTTTLAMITAQFTTLASGNDVIVTVIGSGGGMTLKDAKGKSINFETYNDVAGTSGAAIYVEAKNATVTGTQNADTINNNYGGAVIFAGKGNDSIKSSVSKNYTINSSYGYVTIDGGAGNDTISANDPYVSILGGDGNDYIYLNNTQSYRTIGGGAGNDTIYLNGGSENNLVQYASGDGNDIITGLNADDTLYITSGSVSSASVKGDDVILTVGSGKVTLKGSAGVEFNLKVGSAAAKSTVLDGSSIPAGISISGAVLTATSAFTGNKIDLADYASTVTKVNASALSRGISIVGSASNNSLKGGKGADTISGGAGNDTVSLGGGTDVYVYTSGNDVIQDYVAGTDKIKLSSGLISSSSLSGSDVILTTSNGKITVKKAKGKQITVINANGTSSTRLYGVYTEYAYNQSIVINQNYTGTLNAADYPSDIKIIDATAAKSMKIYGNAQANTIYGSKYVDTIYGDAGNDYLSGDVGNDKLYGDAGDDTLIGGSGNDTLTGGDGSDVFIYGFGGGNDVIADFTTDDKITVSAGVFTSASLKSSDMVFSMGTNTLTVKNGKNKEISIGSAIYYNNLTYDTAKTAATLGSAFTGTLKAADYSSTVKTIDATRNTKAIGIVGNAQANTINGGNGAEKIYGGAGNDLLYGNAGKDTLGGDAGNDTLYGGAGSDTFIYSAGNDVIADYAKGDKISLSGASVTGATLQGSDMYFQTSGGSLTVKNAKGMEITLGGAVYCDNLVYNTAKTALTLGGGFSGSLKAADYNSKVKTINASALTSGVAIVGNAQANAIIGGSGNDALGGMAGNDTLIGGAGSDTFVYTTGKDVISDYTENQDEILLGGTVKKTSLSGSDVVFAVGSGTLTVKNGRGKAITTTDIDGHTTTMIYDGFSGSNGYWFTEDDSDFTGGARLSDITAENYSVTQIETQSNFENFAQNETLLAHSDK